MNNERISLYKSVITDIKKHSKPRVDYKVYENTMKDRRKGKEKTYHEILTGFYKSKKKEGYVKRNRKSILKLAIDEQEKIYRIIMNYL